MKILVSDPIEKQTMKELKKYGKLLKKGQESEADVTIVRSRTKVNKNYIDKCFQQCFQLFPYPNNTEQTL